MSSKALPAALLFDLDGTLVETDHIHLLAFQRVFAPYGIELDRARYDSLILGSSNDAIGRAFLPRLDPAEQARVLEEKEAVYRAEVGAVAPVAGFVELLDFCDARGLQRAVVTNAPRANVDLMLGAMGLEERLPIVVSGAELARAKPDPLPYLTGLRLTGARAENSVAFEDSLSGVRAAAAAGLAVVGLTTGLDEARLVAAGALFAAADFRDSRIYELIEACIAA
ncbi:MAG: HAD family hydrolase [Roseiarcus sp.]